MQAMPGFISGDSWLPPAHIVWLVQTGAQPEPDGYPAATQAVRAAISAVVAFAAGAGGIGSRSFCMRASATSAFVFVPSLRAGPRNDATSISAGRPTAGD